MFSNKYIFIYTGVLVVAVAVVLALAATLLQPMQTRNKDAAKKQEILKASGVVVESRQAADCYDSIIVSEFCVDKAGNVYDESAFKVDMKVEMAKEEGHYPVFVCDNGLYIMPLQGTGLWGAIWGYLAVERDCNTVAGVTFGHQGETPGLGAEITGAKFQSNFKGKKLFDEDGNFISITAQKGGAEKYPGDISHAVDAVSGGTITSNGVTEMLASCMGVYVPFLKKMRDADSSLAAPVADTLR